MKRRWAIGGDAGRGRAAMGEALAWLDGVLEERKCPPAVQSALDIVFDEILSNIVNYSGASMFELDVSFPDKPAGVRLEFVDDGAPYDPLAHTDPDTTLSLEDRPIGGLGIFLVKKLMNSVSYARADGLNRLEVFKSS